MKAIAVQTPGGPDALKVLDIPTPEPGPGQVRIRVEAAAVNPVDLSTRTGELIEFGLMAPSPRIAIGWDVAGTIDAVGEGASSLAAGDPVIALRDQLAATSGTHAEFVVLDAGAVAPAPEGMSAVEASTLPLNALTAWQALDLLELDAGGTLLVTGAAGAVGGFAVELAAQRGLTVVASASAADEALARELGATHFVPRPEALGEAVRAIVLGGVDGALDTAGVGVTALDAVRNRGSFVTAVGGSAPPPLRGTVVRSVFISADGEQLARISEQAAAGRLTPRVAATLPLAAAAEAHRRMEAGGLRGRIVLIP